MTDTLRIVEGQWIELDGKAVARLLPLSLSSLDRLTAIFDAIDEDAEYIARLEQQLTEAK